MRRILRQVDQEDHFDLAWTMPVDSAYFVRAGKCGLMDMLAGGHVDDATFRQAIELLKLEDWEALRLLLAGEACCCIIAPGNSNTCTFTPPACGSRGARKPELSPATEDRCRESASAQSAEACRAC